MYKKPISGAPQVQLTFSENGLVDGPTYSPDGKCVYGNSSEQVDAIVANAAGWEWQRTIDF